MLEVLNSSKNKGSSLSGIGKVENNVDGKNDYAFLPRYENDGNFIS